MALAQGGPVSGSGGDDARIDRAFGEAIGQLGPSLLAALDALEQAYRRLHPPDFSMLQVSLAPVHDALRESDAAFRSIPPPDSLCEFREDLAAASALLLSPTSRESTWSLNAPEIDGHALRQMTEWVASQWNVDREHVLLTGLSDGATMTLLVGLGDDTSFTHLAPISGVLHPMNFAIGNLDRAREKPIYLVHGALDWMFPVVLAQEAARVLEDAGARLVYRELADLSHTYTRARRTRRHWNGSTRDSGRSPRFQNRSRIGISRSSASTRPTRPRGGVRS